ncbi:hypothetical protein RJT34_19983 [Clitoria ternatea]|uniref:Factor of DNA methylation 1-5/IDN2 domain-containing protein n=1 Tax=Clitoria ternatea TaxID=43366 RepID=A0AAN9ISD3_CLITE
MIANFVIKETVPTLKSDLILFISKGCALSPLVAPSWVALPGPAPLGCCASCMWWSKGIKKLSSHGNICLKRMGELDTKPFLEAMKKRYNEEEVEGQKSELCSLWEWYLKDPNWHTFKVIMLDGKEKG